MANLESPGSPTGSTGLTKLAQRLRARLGDPSSLLRRVVESSLMRLGGHGASQIIRLGSNLVMTRLLAPEAFGLMAVVFTVQTGLSMLTDVGIVKVIMRSPNGEDPRFLRVAWTFKIIKHTLVAALMVGAAALLGVVTSAFDLGDTIYADPRLPLILSVACLAFVIRGARSTNVDVAERRMKVAPLIRNELTTQIVTVAATISIAFYHPSVWALVFGGLIGATVGCAQTHLRIPGPRMGLLWDREYAAEIWHYGKWLIGASFFGFINRHGDSLILAALMSPISFSLYAIARIWINAVSQLINKVSGKVTFAAFGEVARDRPRALPRVFAKARLAQNLICLVGFIGVAFIAEHVIEALYVGRFNGVGVLVALLAPMILMEANLPFGSLMLATGDSRSVARIAATRSVALIALTPLAFTYLGEAWAIFFVSINRVWGSPLLLSRCAKIVPLRLWRFYALLAAAIAVSAAAAVYNTS